MRRGSSTGKRWIVVATLAVLPLGVGITAAQAQRGRSDDGSTSSRVAVVGTIVSVDAADKQFVANAYEVDPNPRNGPVYGSSPGYVNGPGAAAASKRPAHYAYGFDRNAPTTTAVTITTSSTTKFRINGATGTLSSLAAGDRFQALFNGSPGTDITTLVTGNPALGVNAWTPPRLYAFEGTVTAVTPGKSGGTVTVDVSNSLPFGLVSPSSNPATFTVGSHTQIVGGAGSGGLSGGSLSDLTAGDVVTLAVSAPSGETLSQIEATRLGVLIDFPRK